MAILRVNIESDIVEVVNDSGALKYTDDVSNFESDSGLTVPSTGTYAQMIYFASGSSVVYVQYDDGAGLVWTETVDWSTTDLENLFTNIEDVVAAQTARAGMPSVATELGTEYDARRLYDYYQEWVDWDDSNIYSLPFYIWDTNADGVHPGIGILSYFQLLTDTNPYKVSYYRMCSLMGVTVNNSTVGGSLTSAQQETITIAGLMSLILYNHALLIQLWAVERL